MKKALKKEEVEDIEEYLRNAGLININETIEHLVISSNEEVEQLDEAGAQPRPTQAAAAADRDHYDKMLDDLMKSQGKRLLKKHSAEVKKSRDIESGKALTQHVKKNPGVLKTYSNAVKKDKKMYGEEVEQIDEYFSIHDAKTGNHLETTHYAAVPRVLHHTKQGKSVLVKNHKNGKIVINPGDNVKQKLNQLSPGSYPNSLKKEDVEHIDERTLTKGETAEKERIVKGMKKSLSGFKARYGEKAKSVMYATATKAAKKD